jgi:hypothetical protein
VLNRWLDSLSIIVFQKLEITCIGTMVSNL